MSDRFVWGPGVCGIVMRHRSAFSVVELLVVIAIIAVLLAIVVPSVQKAKQMAVRALCATNLKAIRTASGEYAADWREYYPYRPPGSYLPHVFWNGGSFDLNETFAKVYLPANRKDIMFCPGKLYQARSPYAPGWTAPGGYAWRYVSYTYFNFHPSDGYGNWLTAEAYPNMATTVSASPRYALWGCLTVVKHWAYLAHDCPQTPVTPLGMNAAFLNGSARWIEWEDMAPFWDDGGQDFYWPFVE